MAILGKSYPETRDDFFKSRLPGEWDESKAGRFVPLLIFGILNPSPSRLDASNWPRPRPGRRRFRSRATRPPCGSRFWTTRSCLSWRCSATCATCSSPTSTTSTTWPSSNEYAYTMEIYFKYNNKHSWGASFKSSTRASFPRASSRPTRPSRRPWKMPSRRATRSPRDPAGQTR